MRGEWSGKDEFWVYWKRPEEWGDVVWRWVDAVGQKGAVLTFYELLHGEGTVDQGIEVPFQKWKCMLMLLCADFHEMDTELFAKAMSTLVKKGKAHVFGDEESKGIKFF